MDKKKTATKLLIKPFKISVSHIICLKIKIFVSKNTKGFCSGHHQYINRKCNLQFMKEIYHESF